MRNLLIILWLILIGVIAVPVCLDYMNGTPKDDVLSVIQRETETDDIRVTLGGGNRKQGDVLFSDGQ